MSLEKINIGIAGFGNIGSNFYKILERNKKKIAVKTGKIPFIKYVLVKNIKKKRKVKIPKSKFIKDINLLTKSNDIKIVVELIGGSDGLAKKLVFSALNNGKHVITANKALMAKHGDELSKIAEKNNVNLEYEASVAGGVPIIRSLKDSLSANKIYKIYGILNGTTNFILSSMTNSKKNFSEVLNKAKMLGFAESNPISDINGMDSQSKLRILSSISFNTAISKNNILTEGIQNINLTDILYAKSLGYKIKLLSISEIIQNKLMERVHPCLIPESSYIAKIDGVLNAIVIDGDPTGISVMQGAGAGPGPTCSSIVSDLCSVLRGNIKYPFGVSSIFRKKIKKFDILKHVCSSYLRIEVKDIPGVLSSITKIFAINKISIKNLIQKPDKKNKKATIIIITHESSEKNYNNLIKSLTKNNYVIRKPTLIRIEKV